MPSKDKLSRALGRPLIPAPNLSQGFHPVLFELVKEFAPGSEMIMVAENPAVRLVVSGLLGEGWTIDFIGYEGKKGQGYEVDLNTLQEFDRQYDVVFSQALLEHVCRPSIVIENLIRLAKPHGIAVVHTHNPQFPYHAFPIDCVRFFADFWSDLAKYIPYNLVWFAEHRQHQFVVLRKPNAFDHL